MEEDWHIIITAAGRPLSGANGSPVLFPGIEAAQPFLTRPGDRLERWTGGFPPMKAPEENPPTG